jgi:hypothetical protein
MGYRLSLRAAASADVTKIGLSRTEIFQQMRDSYAIRSKIKSPLFSGIVEKRGESDVNVRKSFLDPAGYINRMFELRFTESGQE